jgi:ribosomal protein L37AE/L43A
MKERYWLLLEKSDDTRISKGIDGYLDKTGEAYHYDSLVPNHKQMRSGDYIVLRKENRILGVGRVKEIAQKPDTKIHRRCPTCRSTDIRQRMTKFPTWKCGKCAHEFNSPEETIVEVQSFIASISDFAQLNAPPSVQEVKRCATEGDGTSSQLSILELNPSKIQTLLEGVAVSPSPWTQPANRKGQGFGLSQLERKAVEMRAMRVARQLYEQDGWEVVDKSGSNSFDLLATRGKDVRYIEVKGTTGQGATIILTHGELKHAKDHKQCSSLVVVSKISVLNTAGNLLGLGGEVRLHKDPWTIDESLLEPTEYRYRIDQ